MIMPLKRALPPPGSSVRTRQSHMRMNPGSWPRSSSSAARSCRADSQGREQRGGEAARLVGEATRLRRRGRARAVAAWREAQSINACCCCCGAR